MLVPGAGRPPHPAAYPTDELGDVAYGLYEEFRPAIAAGRRGWGQVGELRLEVIRALAKKRQGTRNRE